MLRVDWSFSVEDDGAAMVRQFWLYSGTAPTGATCVSLAQALQNAWIAHMTPQSGTNGGSNGVTVQDISSSTGADGQYGVFTAGTGRSGSVPRSCAALVNYAIARRYRGGKPRSYFPIAAGGDINTTGDFLPGSVSAWDTAYAAFTTAAEAISVSGTSIVGQRNVSYFSGYTLGPAQPGGYRKKVPTLRAGGPQVDPITSASFSTKPGSQRRRTRAGA